MVILLLVNSMKIRLGYVAISKALDVTSSSAFTFTNFNKSKDYNKLDSIIKSNFEDLIKILNYNVKNNIHFYRLTSKLIPLATHKDVDIEYIDKYKDYYNKISNIINKNNMRVDVHPDQFCVLNSTKKEVIENTIEILKYHINILEALNIKNPIIVLHVGSSVLGKENSIKRFINTFNKLPDNIKNAIALENDDKIFNAKDVLYICNKLHIPFVFDYHHHKCNPCNDIENIMKDILNTWTNINPKMHISSPKNKTKKDFRSHNDYINYEDFNELINLIKPFNKDVDIMIEAKSKDDALFRLIRQIKYNTNYKFIDDTSFMI